MAALFPPIVAQTRNTRSSKSIVNAEICRSPLRRSSWVTPEQP